jgi:virginiamycin A acetyltransferase
VNLAGLSGGFVPTNRFERAMLGWVRSRLAAIDKRSFYDRLERRGAVLGRDLGLDERSRVWSDLEIGDGTNINGPFVSRGQGSFRVGRYCAVGEDLRVITSNHDLRSANVQLNLQKRLGLSIIAGDRQDVSVGNNVWIGDSVTLLPGARIGDGAVIGAGSIVTSEIPPFAVAAGVPARELRHRFPPDMVAALVDIAWWDWSFDRMRRNRAFFDSDLTRMTPEEVRKVIVL